VDLHVRSLPHRVFLERWGFLVDVSICVVRDTSRRLIDLSGRHINPKTIIADDYRFEIDIEWGRCNLRHDNHDPLRSSLSVTPRR